jgi:hypothetical protein
LGYDSIDLPHSEFIRTRRFDAASMFANHLRAGSFAFEITSSDYYFACSLADMRLQA